MQAVCDRNNPWNGIIPVTPIMDQQLDQIIIREILIPWRDSLLRELDRKIYDHKKAKENWFEVYLTIFILLNSTEVQLVQARVPGGEMGGPLLGGGGEVGVPDEVGAVDAGAFVGGFAGCCWG